MARSNPQRHGMQFLLDGQKARIQTGRPWRQEQLQLLAARNKRWRRVAEPIEVVPVPRVQVQDESGLGQYLPLVVLDLVSIPFLKETYVQRISELGSQTREVCPAFLGEYLPRVIACHRYARAIPVAVVPEQEAKFLGLETLVDTEGRRFTDKGLGYQDYDAEAEILADPLILRTPIVRDGQRATVGYQPDAWRKWIKGKRG